MQLLSQLRVRCASELPDVCGRCQLLESRGREPGGGGGGGVIEITRGWDGLRGDCPWLWPVQAHPHASKASLGHGLSRPVQHKDAVNAFASDVS